MGIICQIKLKCNNCGYEYIGTNGGHATLDGFSFFISQYYCETCNSIVDIAWINKREGQIYIIGNTQNVLVKNNYSAEEIFNTTLVGKREYPLCKTCNNQLIEIPHNEAFICPKCKQKALEEDKMYNKLLAFID